MGSEASQAGTGPACRVSFAGPDGERSVDLPAGSELRFTLDFRNSPVPFGCRTGLCGTCLVEVEVLDGGALPGPDAEEREILELLAPQRPLARLACQLRAGAAMRLKPLGRVDAA